MEAGYQNLAGKFRIHNRMGFDECDLKFAYLEVLEPEQWISMRVVC